MCIPLRLWKPFCIFWIFIKKIISGCCNILYIFWNSGLWGVPANWHLISAVTYSILPGDTKVSYGQVLGTPHDKLCYALLNLKYMGFDLESSYFCRPIQAFCHVPEALAVLLGSFGFFNHEIISVLKKLPFIMPDNEKNFNEKLEFFLKKLQWTPLRLWSNPVILSYSLKTITIPIPK